MKTAPKCPNCRVIMTVADKTGVHNGLRLVPRNIFVCTECDGEFMYEVGRRRLVTVSIGIVAVDLYRG